jgi:hypothetical protein
VDAKAETNDRDMEPTDPAQSRGAHQVQTSELKAKASALRVEAEVVLRQLREVLVSVQRGLDQETTGRP